jgi:putative aminopeptidase FrvX
MKGIPIDTDGLVDFLVSLLNTPSPSGYCEAALELVERRFASIGVPGLALARTVKGALVATIPGRSGTAPRAMSAHVDTLGAMVREVKVSGRLLLTQIGGYAWQAIEGENVTVHCVRDGRRYRGTVQTVTPSTHTSKDVREGERSEERMEVRLDVITHSKTDTLALGIDVGDFVSLDPRVEVTDTGFVKSRHLDDKAAVAVIYGALCGLKAGGFVPSQRTILYVSHYEEVGHGASSGIPADVVELVAVDMAASTTGEHQNSDEYSVGICAKDSSGPYDLEVRRKLVRLCESNGIPFKVDTYPFYGSDASAFLRAGGAARTGLIGPGLDASHAYERTHRQSLEASARLVAHWMVEE